MPLIFMLAPSERAGDGKTNAAGRAGHDGIARFKGSCVLQGDCNKGGRANCCIAMLQRRGGKMNPNRSMLLKDRFNRPIGIC
jgi:hypothetical protein